MIINIQNLVGLAVYLGIGLLVYLLLYAPAVFSWANPWVYVVALLWPLALAWEIIWVVIWIFIIVVVAAIIIVAFQDKF